MAEVAINDAWQKAYADKGATVVVTGIAEPIYASQTLQLAIESQNIGSCNCLDFCQLALGTHSTCTYLAHHELESVSRLFLLISSHIKH